jgi:hypothetical protein
MRERAELLRALGSLVEPPVPALAPVAHALGLQALPEVTEHSEIFLFQLYPYASVYTGAEGMLGGDAADRVAGFWRAVGIVPPAEPDHLAVLLALHAGLIDAEHREPHEAHRKMRREARRALLWEHLLSWLPVYLDKLEEIGGDFYRSWGHLLAAALFEEADDLGPPDRLPLHLRSVPGLPSVDGGAAELLSAILAPARSGLLLTRLDLARGAASIGVGLRMGERRFVLETMLGQDAPGTLAWLAGEARAWERRHLEKLEVLGPIGGHWAEMAAAAGDFFVSSSEAAEGAFLGGTGS